MSKAEKNKAQVKGLRHWLIKDFPEVLRREFVAHVRSKNGRVPFVVGTLVSRYMHEERMKD